MTAIQNRLHPVPVKPVKRIGTILRWCLNAFIALLFFIPFYWMFIT